MKNIDSIRCGRRRAEVIIAARDLAKGEQAVQALQTEYPETCVHFLPPDLGFLASVRQTCAIEMIVAAYFLQQNPPL